MAHPDEKYLKLPTGRTIAYEDAGYPNSSSVIIMFHGAFGVGYVPQRPLPIITEKHLHFIAPTLPGWGATSPLPPSSSFASGIISDVTSLINHLHPEDPQLKLYIVGGSFGTVPAQILYGASYDIFPLGRHIAALGLLAPFSPARYHTGYAKDLSWQEYLMIGPPASWIPFNLIPRLSKPFIASKFRTVEGAEIFIRKLLFDNMEEAEREDYDRWKNAKGVGAGELERELAENVVRSVSMSWHGFFCLPSAVISDWGFSPEKLDDEHARAPILVVASKGDRLLPGSAMADWIIATYKNSRLKTIEGGHISGIFHIDEFMSELFAT